MSVYILIPVPNESCRGTSFFVDKTKVGKQDTRNSRLWACQKRAVVVDWIGVSAFVVSEQCVDRCKKRSRLGLVAMKKKAMRWALTLERKMEVIIFRRKFTNRTRQIPKSCISVRQPSSESSAWGWVFSRVQLITRHSFYAAVLSLQVWMASRM